MARAANAKCNAYANEQIIPLDLPPDPEKYELRSFGVSEAAVVAIVAVACLELTAHPAPTSTAFLAVALATGGSRWLGDRRVQSPLLLQLCLVLPLLLLDGLFFQTRFLLFQPGAFCLICGRCGCSGSSGGLFLLGRHCDLRHFIATSTFRRRKKLVKLFRVALSHLKDPLVDLALSRFDLRQLSFACWNCVHMSTSLGLKLCLFARVAFLKLLLSSSRRHKEQIVR
mmetsp:Transcript_50890/g.135199  ORF Transcript_50890/g.135199 Transcript_50890/m.135199 type:complete len:227 (-) Transcript_50890:65-745(-)